MSGFRSCQGSIARGRSWSCARRPRTAVSALYALALLAIWCRSAPAQDTWHEAFEGPDISWRPAGGDMQFRADVQRRVQGVAHSGSGCEQLQVTANNGSTIYFSHAVPPARIFSELTAGVWLRADRPGIQIFARAVLPHTPDPQTGGPATVLLPGGSYSQVGVWEQLRLADTPQLLERQLRVLRLQLGAQRVERARSVHRSSVAQCVWRSRHDESADRRLGAGGDRLAGGGRGADAQRRRAASGTSREAAGGGRQSVRHARFERRTPPRARSAIGQLSAAGSTGIRSIRGWSRIAASRWDCWRGRASTQYAYYSRRVAKSWPKPLAKGCGS